MTLMREAAGDETMRACTSRLLHGQAGTKGSTLESRVSELTKSMS